MIKIIHCLGVSAHLCESVVAECLEEGYVANNHYKE